MDASISEEPGARKRHARIRSCEKIQTGRDREGEVPAEPHGARTSGAMAHQEVRPPNSFTPSQGREGLGVRGQHVDKLHRSLNFFATK